jgi:pimeloyl-ACP methyl ester carboxylesterase
MKRIGILMLLVFTCLLSAEWLQAQRPTPPPNVNPRIPHFPIKPGVPQIPQLLRRVEPARLPASATPDVIQSACPPEAEALGAVCGYVPVPLDRKHPNQGTINVYFELYPHSGSGPAESAILMNLGGPGGTTSGYRNFALYLFGQNLDVHDLLLIDDRGRGLSGAIDCGELQHGTAAWDQATADCAAQLENAASRYGTGDVGQDTEVVRAALGYDKLDYFGLSYGGADVTAYATRFGEHLRSITLDAPFGTPGLDESRFVFDRYRTHAEPRMVRLDCLRSPTCSPDHPFPNAELDALIWTVRLWPVEGDAYDANGNLKHVRIDEDQLLGNVIDNNTGNFASTGELLAAAASLWTGDPQPLLRLEAEGYFSQLEFDNGDPTSFSVGALQATACVDMHEPWDWSAPVPVRTAQYADAVSALPPGYFAPFSKSVATGLLFSFFGRDCLYWEKPTPSSPVAPSHAKYPHVPTLVLSGDMDSRVPLEEVTKVAALFPNSTLVPVAEAGHGTVFWTACAANLASQFIENLQVGDTICASTPETIWPAVGRFPLLAKFARPAAIDPDGYNQISTAERKVVTVAVATATDAMQRSIIGFGDGVGLRGGTFHTDYSGPWTTTLTNCAFAKDVTVNGTVTWDVYGSFVADLTVSGSGTTGGTLHVEGAWQAPGPVGNFKVSGTLGGKQVAVLVPEA